MDSIELKNLQAPLKEKYRIEPSSALITLKAEGKVGEGISCSVETGRAIIEAGLHPATGGTRTPGLLRRFITSGPSGMCQVLHCGLCQLRLELK